MNETERVEIIALLVTSRESVNEAMRCINAPYHVRAGDPPSLKEIGWANHPDHPRADWQYEVANADTNLGYQEWLEHQIEMAKDDPPAGLQFTGDNRADPPKWNPPVLRDFSPADWDSWSGCDSDSPEIADLVIEEIECVLIVDGFSIGLYPQFTTDEGPSWYTREFSQCDEFSMDMDMGRQFANWFIKELCESTTFWELTERFGFEKK